MNAYYAKAERIYVQALEIRKRDLGEKHPDYAKNLYNLARVYQAMGDYTKAEPLYVQAHDVLKKTLGIEHQVYVQSLSGLAGLYRSMGAYAKAEPLCIRARDICRKTWGEENRDYAMSLHELAQIYQLMGAYAKAEPLYIRSRDICRRTWGKENREYAAILANLAALYRAMGEYTKAEPLFVQACDIHKKVLGEEHPDYATSLHELAWLYEAMGEHAKAELFYTRALNITREFLGEENLDYAASLNSLALLYISRKDYMKAAPLCVRALEITTKTTGKEHPQYAACLNTLAGLYYRMGEYAKAEPLFIQVLEIAKKRLGEGHPHYAAGLYNLASVYQAMGAYTKAESLLVRNRNVWRKVLGEDHPHYATSLMTLASLYFSMGEYAKAEPLAQAAMDMKTMFANKVVDFLPEARAMALRENLVGPHMLLSILRKMPKRSDRTAYTAVWRTRGLVSRSLAVRRRGRGRSPEAKALWVRLQTTAQQLAQLTLAVPRSNQRKARQQRLAELNDEKERLEAELARTSVEFRRDQENTAAGPEDLVDLLQQDEAVVELLLVAVWNRPPGGRGKPVSERHYDAFVLRRGTGPKGMNVSWVQLGPADVIDKPVARWRKAITDEQAPAAEARQAADDLRHKVWDKIEPHLAGCTRVTVIPDGRLCFVPWAALPGRKPGTCLLEDYAIVTAQSARQLFAMLTETPSAGGKLLVVGGVAYDSEPAASPRASGLLASNTGAFGRTRSPAVRSRLHWDPLPATATEVDAVAKGWSGKPKSVVFRGSEASEQALRENLPGSRYIHLATHGFFADEKFRSMFGHDVGGERLFSGLEGQLKARRATVTARNPLILSGVVLAGANRPPKTDKLGLPTGEDGILTAEEIVNLDLRGTELAVLSACDTGLGDVAGGEGVMGLARAFHMAGTRNVVASLWKVDDDATAALMKLFYYKLWQEKKPPIEALRQAQMAIYRHPEEIKALASGTRGPKDLSSPVKLPDGGAKVRPAKTAPARLWAGFILSGPGN